MCSIVLWCFSLLMSLYLACQTAALNTRPHSMCDKLMLGEVGCTCSSYSYMHKSTFRCRYVQVISKIVLEIVGVGWGAHTCALRCVLVHFRSILNALLCSGVAHSAGAECSVRMDNGLCASARPIRQQSKTNDCG